MALSIPQLVKTLRYGRVIFAWNQFRICSSISPEETGVEGPEPKVQALKDAATISYVYYTEEYTGIVGSLEISTLNKLIQHLVKYGQRWRTRFYIIIIKGNISYTEAETSTVHNAGLSLLSALGLSAT